MTIYEFTLFFKTMSNQNEEWRNPKLVNGMTCDDLKKIILKHMPDSGNKAEDLCVELSYGIGFVDPKITESYEKVNIRQIEAGEIIGRCI